MFENCSSGWMGGWIWQLLNHVVHSQNTLKHVLINIFSSFWHCSDLIGSATLRLILSLNLLSSTKSPSSFSGPCLHICVCYPHINSTADSANRTTRSRLASVSVVARRQRTACCRSQRLAWVSEGHKKHFRKISVNVDSSLC